MKLIQSENSRTYTSWMVISNIRKNRLWKNGISARPPPQMVLFSSPPIQWSSSLYNLCNTNDHLAEQNSAVYIIFREPSKSLVDLLSSADPGLKNTFLMGQLQTRID